MYFFILYIILYKEKIQKKKALRNQGFEMVSGGEGVPHNTVSLNTKKYN